VWIVPSTVETATRCCSVPRNPIAAPFSSRPACPGGNAGWPEGEKVGSRPDCAGPWACLVAVTGEDDGSAARPRIRAFKGTNPSDW